MRIMKKVIYALITVVISLIIYASSVSAATTLEVTADTLNLREKASTSSNILTLLSKGEECEFVEEYGEWYKVKYKTYTGYVSKEYVQKLETSNNEESDNTAEDNTEPQETIVTGEISKKTKARILPLIQSSVLETLDKGTKIEIITETNGWSYITTEEIAAWIRSDSIKGKKTETNIVENEKNSEDTKKEEDKKEDKIETPAKKDEEVKQEENKQETTNSNTFEEKTMYVKESYVNLRKKASTSSDIVMVVALNTKLTVIGEEGDWYKLKTSEGEAYVSKELVSDKKTTTTSRGDNVVRGETENTSEGTKNTETKKEEKESSKTSTTTEKTTTTTSSTSNKGEEIVAYAKKFLGVPYVYGGASSNGFDCSGFTMYVYKKFGISMRHGAQAQAKLGTVVNADKSSASSLKKNLKPGDLVFFLDYETMDEIGHCGIYIGDGKFIHASSGSGYCVKINSLLPGEYYNTRYCAARRVI